MPKGVMWRGEDIYHAALSGFDGTIQARPEDVVGRVVPEEQRMIAMLIAPLMHGAAQWGLMNMLYAGGTVVLYVGRGFDAHEICRVIERERVMSMLVVGDAMARPIADAIADPATSYDLSSLLAISSGGAVFSPTVRDQLRTLLPNVFVVDSFGASETGANGQNVGTEARRFTVNPETTVLGEDLRPVTPGSGQIGRLARRGHIPLGYYKDEAKTAATFVTDADGERWVVPGDFATIEEDGAITVLGRGSQCINTGGEKVYPEEVEEALKSHPDVFDALVVGVPDDRFGERVAAVVAPRPGTTPTLDELSAHCRQTIAGYKSPRQVVLVDAVQRTPAGKANYRWAKETAAAG
jgi:3-oxocholest-4-en-26-oate---CoA ligase